MNHLELIDVAKAVTVTGLTIQYPRPRVLLKDGTSLSIQASEYHYCHPRVSGKKLHEYETVEVGFPSKEIPELKEFAEEEGNWTETVYPYVPIELVQALILARGGIAETLSQE